MKVLFVGNSHTFFNDMPEMIRLFGKARNLEFEVVQNTAGGRGLDWQSNQFDVRFNILYGNYDYIVLQHIAHPFPGEENLLHSASLIMPYLRQTSSRPVNFQPWSEQALPEKQAEINAAHKTLLERYPELLNAPIAMAWDDVRHSHPEVELYWHDGEHASPLGSYLVAATLFRLLTGERAEGLPFELEMGKPTFAGLTLDKELVQDFNCATSYSLDPVACTIIARAVDKHTPGR